MAELDLKVNVLDLRPGDIIVIESQRRVTLDAANYIKEKIADAFDGKHKVIVLEDGLELKVVRPDEKE